MDPLTQVVTVLRPRALLWKEMTATGDWAVRFPPSSGVVFCRVAGGRCVFQMPGRASRVLREGDVLLLAASSAWTLGNSEGAEPADYGAVYAGPDVPTALAGRGDAGPAARVLGGRFEFDDANAALLDGVLPAMVAVRPHDPGAARLRAVLDLLGDEAASARPGRTLVLDRLLEVLLVEAVRHGTGPAADGRRGLLAGLADPRLAVALRALHADPRRGAHAFSAAFSRAVGCPPSRYAARRGAAPPD